MPKVGRLIGHESIETTVEIYGHLNIEELRQQPKSHSIMSYDALLE
jgi:site-specific recombinase XerD